MVSLSLIVVFTLLFWDPDMITTVSACQNHIVICEIFICSLSFCPSPLPCLENVPCSTLPPYLCSSPPTKTLHSAMLHRLPLLYSFSDYPGFFPLRFCYSTLPRPFCYRISQSSQSQSRGYAKPWLAHSKTPTPTKCQSCPEHSQTPGHEVTHCPLPVP